MNLSNELLEYLKKKQPNYSKTTKKGHILFTCPNIEQHKYKAKDPTATFIPGSDKINCLQCGWKGTAFDSIRVVERNRDLTDAQILESLSNNSKTDLFPELDLYKTYNWSLFPIAKNSKVPIAEQHWREKTGTSTEKGKWIQWLNNELNLAVNCEFSKIMIIDVDTKEVTSESLALKEEIIDMLEESKTVIQNTPHGGKHYIFLLDNELCFKQKVDIGGLKIDTRTDKGYFVVAPSKINNTSYCWINLGAEIKEIPSELKLKLLELSKLKKNVANMPENATPEQKGEVTLLGEGNRNDTLLSLGGILVKQLSSQHVEFVLNIINNNFVQPKLPAFEIKAMLGSLAGYKESEEETQERKIYDACKLIQVDISAKDIMEHTGLKRAIVDKYLAKFHKEGQLSRRGRGRYDLRQKVEWTNDTDEALDLYNYQIPYFSDKAYFQQGDIILLGGKSGTGKCFAKGTGILMADGIIKKVEEIKPNDKVMGVDSKPRKVIQIGTGEEIMYDIIPTKGEKFKVNESHILSLKGSVNPKGNKRKIVNISVKEYLEKNKTFKQLYKLYRVPIDFPEKEILLDPYFLGLWLGDGDKTNPRITTIDNEVINFLTDYAKKLNLKLITYKYPDRCASYAITKGKTGGKKNQFDLHSLLIKENILNNKHIPFHYKTNSKENRLQLLAGLIDSDGYVDSKNYNITITNKKLAEDIVYLCRSLGFLSYLRIKKTSIKSIGYIGKAYRISIIGNCSIIPVKINRKKVTKRLINKDPLITGFKIKKCKKEKYYGFTLNGDHLHLIDSFIVNHNTHIAMNIIKQMRVQGIIPFYISLESGSRYKKIANKLNLDLKQDFYVAKEAISNPLQIEIESNSFTIIDWLYTGEDFAATQSIFKHLSDEMRRKGGVLVVFTQLKDNYDYFAVNLIKSFPSFAARYIYDDETGVSGHWQVDKIRDAKGHYQTTIIPCTFDFDTKELTKNHTI